MSEPYDAILLVSFGGPEGPGEVVPFLENVLRGKNVPRERMIEVAAHYDQFDGVSPINGEVRALIRALVDQLNQHGPRLPVYWGNRNWHPMLADTLQQMAEDGITRALAFVTSAYSSYSGCRQYLEDIERARAAIEGTAPQVEKLRAYYNHPGFVQPMIVRVKTALDKVPDERRAKTTLLFTAHSIPDAMAGGCAYEAQLREASQLVADGVGHKSWELVYQSRSGPPQQPWLEPDICDRIRQLHQRGSLRDVVVVPIGFTSDHLEVIYDLDTEAAAVCEELGVNMVRAATVGADPHFVTMIRQLIEERLTDEPDRLSLGEEGPCRDVCPKDCCPSGRPSRAS